MKRIFTVFWVLIFSCCFSSSSFGQVWTDILEMHYCDITDLKVDDEGNKIIVGKSTNGTLTVEGDTIISNPQKDNVFFVAKISSANNLLWIKHGTSIDNNGDSHREQLDFADIEIDSQGYIYTLFSGNPSKIFWNGIELNQATQRPNDNLLVKFDTNGNEQWSKPINLNGNGGKSHMVLDNQDNIYISATIITQNTDVPTIDQNQMPITYYDRSDHARTIFLLKLDKNANFQWYEYITCSNVERHANYMGLEIADLKFNQLDELVILASNYNTEKIYDIRFSNSPLIVPINKSQHVALISYDTQGNFLDYKNIQPSLNNKLPTLHKLEITSDYIYIYGHIEQDEVYDFPYLVKLDYNKNVVLQTDFGINRNVYQLDYNFSTQNYTTMTVDESNNVYLILQVDPNRDVNSINILGKNVSIVEGYENSVLVKINKNNRADWAKLIESTRQVDHTERWHFDRAIYTDGLGAIYFDGVYQSGEVVGTRQMPTVDFASTSYLQGDLKAQTQFLAKVIDNSFVYTPPSLWLRGKTFIEANNNCQFDARDKVNPTVLVTRNDGTYTVSNRNGDYTMPFSDNQNYTLTSTLLDDQLFRYFQVTGSCDTIKQVIIENGQLQDPNSINFGYKTLPCSYLTIDVTNSQRRRCFMSSTTVEYQNKGFVDAQNVEVKVEYPDYIFPVSSSPAWTRKEGNTYFFNVGNLAAGGFERITFQDSVICGIEEIRGLTQCVKATISPANSCEDWTDTENKYEISGQCVGGGVARYTIQNLTTTSTDSIPYRLYANSQIFQEGNVLLPANGEIEFEVFTNGMTVRMEVFPPNHEPISAFVEGCQIIIPYSANPATPLSASPVTELGSALPQNDGGERMETACSEILDSYDPNDKQVVPFGLTNENLIEATTELDYTIRFQNTGTIEAVNIVVLDTLSEFLDIETIRLGMVSHDYKFFIDGDADTRVLRFEFDNINLPDSNTNEPASHGFIKFKIKQKANNRIGTVIKNRAAIYFDFNSPIITNTISNKVARLPLRNNNLDLPVFNCSDASFELNANAGTDIETPNSTATLAAQATDAFGSWSLLSGFGELQDASKNNTRVTGILPFPSQFVWTVAICGQSKQDTVTVLSTDANYKFTIDLNETTNTLSVPTGKVTYQWYKDGVLITEQTGATLNLNETNSGLGTYTVVISSGGTSVTSEPFTLDVTLSNNDFIEANYIKVYPNPTTSSLNVELHTALNASEITLVNALGMELQKTKVTNSDKITLDLNNLSNGIYFIKIISQKGIFYKKVILKK